MTKFGRYPDKTTEQLGAEAALAAMADAGIEMKDIQSFHCGCLYEANRMPGQRILQQIGQTGIPVSNVANACATGATAFREAYMQVAGGFYDVALAVGVEKMGKVGLLGAGRAAGAGGPPPEGNLGSGLMPAVFGQAGVEHMRKYGTRPEHFAKVSVKNHHHSTANPLAQYQMETPLDQVMSARMIAFPNTLYMCCPTGDGAAAAIVVSEEYALKKGLDRAIKVKASVLTSDPFTDRDLQMPDVNTLTKNCAKQAYEQAGVGPEDLDLVELHDCFATAELLHYENLGLCGEGEGGEFIDRGDPYHGGKTPVNVSGGLLSKGHPLGATGVANIFEVVTHLRGEAGKRQVEGAKVGMTHVIGLGSACAIHVFEA